MQPIHSKEIEEILVHFSTSMFSMNSEEEVLWDMVRNCISILGFEDAVVYLVDESGEYLVQKAAFGPKNPEGNQILNVLKIKIGKGVTGRVAESGLPMLVSDTRNDPEYIEDDQLRLSEIAVPIMLDGKVIGVIDSENSEIGFFSDQHVRILLSVASIYAGQIARIRAEKKVKAEQFERWKIQQKATQLKIEAISAQLSPHFVFNSLNAIQHFILTEDKKSSLRFLGIFGKLLRYFLMQLDKESVLVSEEIQMTDWYLQLQRLRYGEKLRYEVLSHGLKTHPSAKIPSIIVQSLIENLLEEQIHLSDGDLGIRIVFFITREKIDLKVMINNKAKNQEKANHSDYLKSITPWEDYIKLLNEIRPFEIKSDVGMEFCPDEGEECKAVLIQFPNLA
ncbi:histidine kinase [Algoriphagus boritolerans]|uniref:GAF domain-containing protein n=1 Tax=Algoriphagus boritolerans DSM 17298 = JCM 18970 TaxID=1120964 RepID=A0A1H6A7T9_9BACT|nr:histidine kinase [Algoriphagus boritolerans]SEG44442.1 GAF domain-containing protein [Algoriphagus boritolerans DSM 17298 = JCM 18970]